MSIDLFTPWRETITIAALLRKADVLFAVSALSDGYFDNVTITIAALLRKADVLFAVSALSDGYFDNVEDRCVYAEVIGDYFAESGDKTEADMEYEDINGMCHF